MWVLVFLAMEFLFVGILWVATGTTETPPITEEEVREMEGYLGKKKERD